MRFPTPEVAGVFLSLSQRVKGAITSGKAAHYLIGGSPERLRNNLGFHGAIAEFVDALLERAILPYQTTISLPNLAVLPDANLPGHDPVPQGETPPPEVYAPVSFDSVISTARKRARLGHEKRLAPLEFWKAMFRGSDTLARFRGPVVFPTDAGGGSDDGDEPDIAIYPPVMFPDSGESYHDSTYYGFHDVVDTGWEASSEYPSGWRPSIPLTSSNFTPSAADEIGRVALDVWLMLDYPDDSDRTSGATLPMLLSIAGFTGQFSYRHHGYTDTRGVWPWFLDPYGEYNFWRIYGGFQFAGKIATYRHYDWDHWGPGAQPASWATSSPYNFDYVGGIVRPELELAVAKAYNALRSVGIYDPATWEYHESDPADFPPWISPFDSAYSHRSISTTARANLDVLRIQQVLLGSMWANWARMPVVVKVPHVAEKVVRTWHVDEYGNVGEPYDTPVSSKTCSQLSVDQECQWRLSLDPDLEYSRCYGCAGQFYYEIPFLWHSHEGSESAVESYPYFDDLDADGVGLGAAEVRRIVEEAKREKQQAEQDKAAAEQAKAAAEQQLGSLAGTFVAAFAGAQDIDHWTDGATPAFRRPGETWIYDCVCTVEFSSGAESVTVLTYGYRAPNPADDSVPGALLVQDTANLLYQYITVYYTTEDIEKRLDSRTEVVTIHRNGITITVPPDVVAGLWDRRKAREDIADAETRISEVSETAEFGVKVDIGPELFRRILSRHDDLLHTVVHEDCDAYSAALLPEGMAWLMEHGGTSDWTPADPQGGYDYTETAYRRVPVLDSESCPVRVYLAHLLTEGVSPWPAESVVDAEYVKTETVALGMTMLDEAQGAHMGQYGGIEFDFDDDDPKPFCRRVAMSDAPEPGVSAPADTIRGILAALSDQYSPDLPPRAASAVSNGRFDSLLFAEPGIVTGGAPNFGWNVRPAYAWYHPDRGPDMTLSYQWLDSSKLWPYRVTSEQPDGTVSECRLEVNDGFLFYLVVDAYFDWYPLIVTPPLGFHDQMTLRISEHVAVRSEWNWKSMPVMQE